MRTILIDFDGSVTGDVGRILSWHNERIVDGVNIFAPDGIKFFEAPMDYDFYLYTFENGVFIRVDIIEEELN
ncbi:MAG: hypothetical protein WD512_19155 [Candidatus Paceibacterota bacterium]